jgi:hypothetical protein
VAARVGPGGVLTVVLGALAGAAAAVWLRRRGGAAPEAVAGVTLAAAVGGAGLVLIGNPPTALLLVPALHAWALVPLLGRAGAAARVTLLVVPGAAAIALFLAARGAEPERWIGAVASREVPGAVVVGLGVALAAVLVALPAAAGLARPGPPGDQRSGT